MINSQLFDIVYLVEYEIIILKYIFILIITGMFCCFIVFIVMPCNIIVSIKRTMGEEDRK